MTVIRKTTGEAYHSVSGLSKPAQVNVIDGQTIQGNQYMSTDACIIGSGAGGAAVAKELAEGGLNVTVLESGPYLPTDHLTGQAYKTVTNFYGKAGQSFCLGRSVIALPYGKVVGGTTVINAGTCFRTPAKILNRWVTDFGLKTSPEALDPFFRRVEREVNVVQVTQKAAGKNTEIVKQASSSLGWSGDYLFRNVRGCQSSGICTFGCPTSAKQHTGITYMARSWEAGSQTVCNTTAIKILHRNRTAYGVEAITTSGARLTVKARIIVLACGTLSTPGLLKTSGLGNQSRQLGKNLSLHPAGSVIAVMDEPVEMWHGVSQSYYIDEFTDQDLILEGVTGSPDFIALNTALSSELMLRADHLATFGLMLSDQARGRVFSKYPNFAVKYTPTKQDVATIRRGYELLVKLFTAAGAREVLVPLGGLLRLPANQKSANKIAELPVKASDIKLVSGHPLGTTRAHKDPKLGVVDEDFKLHDCDGVYIGDGSIVPTPLGVNPQITIMALATKLAYHLLNKPAPLDEPYPEKIPKPKGREPYCATFNT